MHTTTPAFLDISDVAGHGIVHILRQPFSITDHAISNQVVHHFRGKMALSEDTDFNVSKGPRYPDEILPFITGCLICLLLVSNKILFIVLIY